MADHHQHGNGSDQSAEQGCSGTELDILHFLKKKDQEKPAEDPAIPRIEKNKEENPSLTQQLHRSDHSDSKCAENHELKRKRRDSGMIKEKMSG
ncbi:conserved hypothetical protein [Ricinus communis]|uniref:Uncharacterized protein n=1 Tax=Ricinus communis TaxID=3988 RepID=B9SR00_RICCO|nr:conserved hypothetical protein [Ricinus communis]